MTNRNNAENPRQLLRDLRSSYATGRPHPSGSGAGLRLLQHGGEAARDARTILLDRHVRRAHALACENQVVASEDHLTRLDPTDAAASVFATGLALLSEVCTTLPLAEALDAIAACLREGSGNLSEDVLSILDNVAHGHRPFSP